MLLTWHRKRVAFAAKLSRRERKDDPRGLRDDSDNEERKLVVE
jgi:hypothetical protein